MTIDCRNHLQVPTVFNVYYLSLPLATFLCDAGPALKQQCRPVLVVCLR